jgi:hypothetical protein
MLVSITKFKFSSNKLQLRNYLQVLNLIIRSYLILLGDIISVYRKTPAGTRLSLHIYFIENRFLCDKAIAEAMKSKSTY